MKLATPFRSLLLATLALTVALPAFAQVTGEPINGNLNVRAYPDNVQHPEEIDAATVVYDNTASAANFGFSSTDPAAIFGDELMTTGVGLLSTNKFSIFNGSSAGALLTATFNIQFYDAVTAFNYGGYSTSVNFGAGLNPGFFATITVTGIDPLLINILSTDIIETQTITVKTGTATKLGIASRNPPTVGSSPNTMYISAGDVGPPGFYTVGSTPANPIYQVGVMVPTSTHGASWGRIKNLYR